MEKEEIMEAIQDVKAVLARHGLTISSAVWEYDDGEVVHGLLFCDETSEHALVATGGGAEYAGSIVSALVGPPGLPVKLVDCGPMSQVWLDGHAHSIEVGKTMAATDG